MDAFRIAVEDERSGWRRLAVHGELDLGTMNVLEVVLRDAREHPLPVLVDLGPCAFIDSCGIRALVNGAVSHRDAGLAFEVVCPSSNRQVARVLDLVLSGEIVAVRESIADVDDLQHD